MEKYVLDEDVTGKICITEPIISLRAQENKSDKRHPGNFEKKPAILTLLNFYYENMFYDHFFNVHMYCLYTNKKL